MFNNNYLVISVTPANNETIVPINTSIIVTFAVDMLEDTISTSTLLLKQVNGTSIAANVTYNHTTRQATILPTAPLLKGTEYLLTITGGLNGIKNTIGNTLPESKLYQFTTTFDVLITPPKNITVTNLDGHISLNWLQPDQFDTAWTLSYAAAISTSALDPDIDPASVVWPLTTDSIAPITSTTINVSSELTPTNYYAYVKALHTATTSPYATTVSPWAFTQFVVDDPAQATPGSSNGTFYVVENYPENNAAGVTPGSVKILFSDNVDPATVTIQNFYVIKAELPVKPLTKLSFLTNFAPSNAMSFTIDAFTAPSKIVSLTLNPLSTDYETNYVVIVSDAVRSSAAVELVEPYYFTFISNYQYLFGDPKEVRLSVDVLIANVTDEKIIRLMGQESSRAWDILNHQTTFSILLGPTAEQQEALNEFVESSVVYILLVDTYLGMSKNIGSTRALGDLNIVRGGTLQDLTNLLKEYKQMIKFWEDQLRGHHNRGYAKPNIVSKGENIEAYPAYMTRDLYKDVGQL